MDYLFIILGICLLIQSANIFVEGASGLAKYIGVSPLIIGLTIVAFGTSAPEASVSITASFKHMNEIAIGNAVGSNICNLLLVLGCSALFGKVKADKKVMKRDFFFLLLSSFLLFVIISSSFFLNKNIHSFNTIIGIMLLSLLVIYLIELFKEGREDKFISEKKIKIDLKNIILIAIGLIGVIIGGSIVVNCSTRIARLLHVSNNVIALTIVAIGTSLPELVTSVVATIKGENDIAIGNVVGSNIFNILFILGASFLISPLAFGFESIMDLLIMLSISILIYLIFKKEGSLTHRKGVFLIVLYIIYIYYIIKR